MLLQVLVRNYFERNNSFSGIENGILGGVLRDNCRETGESIEELLYRLLGYEGARSSLALVQLRKDLIESKDTSGKLKGKDPKEAARVLGVSKMSARKPSERSKITKLGLLVSKYYQNDVCNLIHTSSGDLPFCVWLNQNVKMSVNKILNDKEATKCLVKFSTGDVDNPTIYRGVLYTSDELTDDEKKKIQINALKRATYNNSIQRKLMKLSALNLLTLDEIDRELYLQVLDFCMLNNVSYASILKEFWVNVPDLIKAYELTGCAFVEIDNMIYYYDVENDDWCMCQSYAFNEVCRRYQQKHISLVPKGELVYDFVGDGGINELCCF